MAQENGGSVLRMITDYFVKFVWAAIAFLFWLIYQSFHEVVEKTDRIEKQNIEIIANQKNQDKELLRQAGSISALERFKEEMEHDRLEKARKDAERAAEKLSPQR
jgi:hypothetical protein